VLADLVAHELPDDAIMTHFTAGWVSIYQGKPEKGLRHFLEGHAISARFGLIENSKFLPVKGAAAASRHLGNWPEALSYAKEEYRIAVITHHPANMIDALISIAEAETGQGMLRSAETNLRKAISLVSEAGVIVSCIGALCDLGHVLTLQGRNEEARRTLDKARRLALKNNHARLTPVVEGCLGELLLNEGKVRPAEPLLSGAVQKARKQSNSDLLPEAYLRMARLSLAQRSSRRFSYYARKCGEHARDAGKRPVLLCLDRLKAHHHISRGSFEKALTKLQWAELCLKEGKLDEVEQLTSGLEGVFDEAGAGKNLGRVTELRKKIAKQTSYADKVLHVLDAFEKVRSDDDVESVLESVAGTMVSIAGADRGLIVGFNQRGMIQFEASANFAGAPQQHLAISSSILNHVRKSQQPLLLDSAATDRGFGQLEHPRFPARRRHLCPDFRGR